MAYSHAIVRRSFLLIVPALAIVLIAAACGGSSNANSSSSKTVNVSEKEWSITVSGTTMTKGQGDVTIPTGSVTFDVKNDGTVDHAFEIQGNGIDQKTQDIAPGKSTTLKVSLTAGKYEVYCPVPGHKALGMDGYVTAS
jgi:uncharacterized cupredoxin-like copper-binding protein